jgi:hypothetical protein
MLNQSHIFEYVPDNNSNLKLNETLFSFLQRRSIRESSLVDMWKREYRSKKRDRIEAQQHALELEARKWQTCVESNLLAELQSVFEDGQGSDCDLLQGEQKVTDAEKDNMLSVFNELKARKQAPVKELSNEDVTGMEGRALGHFRRLEVSSAGTNCNCEYFRTKGWCDEQRIYDLVEFNIFPPLECQVADGTSWPDVALKCKRKLKSPMFDEVFTPNEVVIGGFYPPPSIDPAKTLSTTLYYDVILPISSGGKLMIDIKRTVAVPCKNAYHSCFAGYTDPSSEANMNKMCMIRNVGDEIVAIDGKNLCGIAITNVLEILRSKKNHRFVHIQLRDIRVPTVTSEHDRRIIGLPKDDANYD